MIYFKLIVLLLQVTQSIIRYVTDQQLISEGEQRVIAKQLEACTAAAKVAKDVHTDVGNKTDAEIDDALRGYFRP